MKGSESMSEATIAITKLRQDKLNPHYRPMIFVIAPFTEVVKSDAKSTMTVRSHDMRYFIRLAKRKNKNIRYFNNEMEAN